MKKVLVLGATGHLGANTAIWLADRGYTVTAVGRRSNDNGFFATKGVDYIGEFELEEKSCYEKLPTDVDAVVHLAGTMPAQANADPMPYVNSIIVGMINLCEWMRNTRCRRIIFNTTPSDVSAFFGSGNPVSDDAPRSFPKDGGDHAVYAISKNAAVDILEHYQIAYGFKPFVLRHMTVYGFHPNPYYNLNGERKMLPWRYIMKRCIAGDDVEVWGDPLRKKELLYVKDLVEVIELAINNEVVGLFNLGGDRAYTLEEQVDGLIHAFSMNKKSKKVFCPHKPNTPQNLLATEKIKQVLNWSHRWTWFDACQDMRIESEKNPYELLWGKKID